MNYVNEIRKQVFIEKLDMKSKMLEEIGMKIHFQLQYGTENEIIKLKEIGDKVLSEVSVMLLVYQAITDKDILNQAYKNSLHILCSNKKVMNNELTKEKQIVFQELINVMNKEFTSEKLTSEVLKELKLKIENLLTSDF